MGGKGSGGYRKNAGTSDAKVDPEDNQRAIAFTIAISKLPPLDLTDPDDIEQRFYDFFELADKYHVRPGLMAYGAALGLSKDQIYYVLNRSPDSPVINGVKLTPECKRIIKKHAAFLNVTLETLMMNDKGNPVKYFFLAKNYFGYKDQSEHLNINVNERPSLAAPEDVAAKYAAQLGKPKAEIVEVSDYELPDGE